MSLFQSSITREEFQYDYHFVVEDKNNEYKEIKQSFKSPLQGRTPGGMKRSNPSSKKKVAKLDKGYKARTRLGSEE